MEDVVRLEIQDGIATVTLYRPEKRNALNREVIDTLQRFLDNLAENEDVRVIVLTGAGKVFCAGADLADLQNLQSATPEENLSDSHRLARLYERIYFHPKPVIAKVNGHAIAGGCGLAVACDITVSVSDARFGFTEVRIGFVPAIVSVFILRKIRETIARELLLRGNLITADEAFSAGLVSRVVPPEKLDASVDTLAREICTETSGTAVALTKRLLGRISSMGLEEALTYAEEMNAFARLTADCQAGISAFLERRDPPWRRTDQ